MKRKKRRKPIKKGERVTTITLYHAGIWGTVENVTPFGVARVAWDDGRKRHPQIEGYLWRSGSKHPYLGRIRETPSKSE